MTPSWITDFLAGLMLVVAGYCAGRVAYARLRHRSTDHDVDVLHVLMGVAMAGMLVSRLSFLNNHIWEALFVVSAVWFVARGILALRSDGASRATAGHQVPYILASVAMLYMYLAPVEAVGSGTGSGGGGMSGMSDASDAAMVASRYPLLGLALVVSMVVYAVLTADRTTLATTTSAGPSISSGASSHCGQLAPRAANCCHIAMSVTMAYLVVVLL